MRANKKKICFLLVLILVLSISTEKYSPMTKSMDSVSAETVKYGVTDIINQNSDDNQFTIVEIVPHKGLAEIGYSISGQEPVSWREYLKTLSNTDEREAYLRQMLGYYNEVLDPYGSDVLKASYTLTEYTERATIPSTSDPSLWTTVDMPEEGSSTQTGYFSFVNDGDGEYRFSDDLGIDYYSDYGSFYKFEPKATSSYPERAQYDKKVETYKKSATDGEYNVTFVYDFAKNHPNEQAYKVVDGSVKGNDGTQPTKKNTYSKVAKESYESIGSGDLETTDHCAKFVLSTSNELGDVKYKVLKTEFCQNLTGFYDKKLDAQGNEVLDENGDPCYVFNANNGRYNVIFGMDESGTYKMDVMDDDFSTDEELLRSLYYKKSTTDFVYYTYGENAAYNVDFMPVEKTTKITDNSRFYYVLNSEKVEKGQGNYAGVYKYVKTSAPNGEYVLELQNLGDYHAEVFTYDKGNGDYNWIQEEPNPFPETNYNASKVYMKDVLISKSSDFCYKGGLINSDRFKKTVLGLTDEQASKFKIKVISVTPEELTEEYQKNGSDSIINHADMFFISDNWNHSPFFMWSWETYTTEGMALTDAQRMTEKVDGKIVYKANAESKLTFNNNSFSEAVMTAIQKRVSQNVKIGTVTLPRAPLVYDTALISRVKSSNYITDLYSNLYKSITGQNSGSSEPRVFENVYAYSGSTDKTFNGQTKVFFNDSYTNNTVDSKYTNNFIDVTENIQNENIIRVANGLEPSGDQLTPNTIIRYILNYENKSEPIEKESITILEVEPSYSEDSVLEDRIRKDVQSWARYFNLVPKNRGRDLNNYMNYTINIVKTTTSEFIGKIEDLNSTYDMIYFGLDTSGMNRVENKDENNNQNKETTYTTVYNDKHLNGKIYLHVGDVVKCGTDLLGLLDRDWVDKDTLKLKDLSHYWINGEDQLVGDQRYPGNDLTDVKYKELTNYVNANYPVLFEHGFFEDGKLEPNNTYLDGASNMYKFARDCINLPNAADSIIFSSSWKPENDEAMLKASYFKTYLANPKLDIKVTEKPTEYAISDEDNTATYLKPNSSGEYDLTYKFTLTDNVAMVADDLSYTVKLYIDVDADGRFADSEEMKGLTVTQGTKKVKANNLVLGDSTSSTFTVTRELPNAYTGVIPWKLVVYKNSDDDAENGYVRDSDNNYTAIQNKASEKEKINILQINKDSTKKEYINSPSTLNLQEQFATMDSDPQDRNNYYYTYGHDLNDYKLNVTTITTDDFDEKKNFSDYSEYLAKFDMIIIGFADCMPYLSNEDAEKAIKNFADEGKCILFTHDTAIFSNVEEGTQLYNRYGSSTGKPDIPIGGDNNDVYRSLCGMDRFNITGTVKGQADNADFEDLNTGYSTTYVEKQGFTTQLLQKMALKWDTTGKPSPYIQYYKMPTFNRYPNVKDDGYYQLKNTNNGASDWARTTEVRRTNAGQITNYPYKIDPEFTVSTTHSQYYQLDMGDDVVVWYTLASDDNKKEPANQRYDNNPNDVRNDYYIYNKGNITYSGVGHSSNPTAMEAKLFINTMIAAYRAADEKPSVTITNENIATNNSGEQLMYIDYDYKKATNSDSESDPATNGDVYTNLSGTSDKEGKECVDVYFRAQNPNLDMEANLYVKYFTVDAQGNYVDCTDDLYKSTFTSEDPEVQLAYNDGQIPVEASNMYDEENKQLDKLYHLYLPFETINNSKDRKFIIKIYYESSLKGKNVLENETAIRFINRNLFDLK